MTLSGTVAYVLIGIICGLVAAWMAREDGMQPTGCIITGSLVALFWPAAAIGVVVIVFVTHRRGYK